MNIYKFILGNRLPLLILLIILTGVMSHFAMQVRLTHEFPRILPADHPDYVAFERFRSMFGEDGKTLMLGLNSDVLYKPENLRSWLEMHKQISEIPGIQGVLDFTNAVTLIRIDSNRSFQSVRLFSDSLSRQSINRSLEAFRNQPFYTYTLYNPQTEVQVMAILLQDSVINTSAKHQVIREIKEEIANFETTTDIETHFSGMVYIRAEMSRIIGKEMLMFIGLSLLVCVTILYFLYQSLRTVVFATMIVCTGVIYSLATIHLLDYRITLLTVLIPPLIIVIGIPNCILLINRYHEEYHKSKNKLDSLALTIRHTGLTTFLANLTTAVGFGVFCFTGSPLLKEFGLVASVNVMVTFLICLIFIPIVFSYLATPSHKRIKHIEAKWQYALLQKVNFWVHKKRKWVYGLTVVILLLAVAGISQIKTIGYFVDDLPPQHALYRDLKFFEKHFTGVLPFEIIVDTGKDRGIYNAAFIGNLRQLEKELASYPEMSKPLGLTEALKFAYQGYRGGEGKFYRVPNYLELNKMQSYLQSLQASTTQLAVSAYTDSLNSTTRISYRIADVGSERILQISDELNSSLDSIFNYETANKQWLPEESRTEVYLTGNSLLSARGNEFLVKNLKESVLLAIVLISLIMAFQFRSAKMMAIAVIPSLLPLLITAGLMGYFAIALKPSTILIFSIAFGIASDGTLYFLTRYKQEFSQLDGDLSKVISKVIFETGRSMIYTAVILFCGFAIFAASSFQGTSAMGILLSITLMIGMLSNLILLPALILSVSKKG